VKHLLSLAIVLCLLLPCAGYADTIVAGISFNDNAFVDGLVSFTGVWGIAEGALPGAPIGLAAQLIGGDASQSFANCLVGTCTVDLAFTDNLMINGAGADFAIFELGAPDNVTITINGVTQHYLTSFTGYNYPNPGCPNCQNNINVAQINLDDFGVASLGLVSEFTATAQYLDQFDPSYTVFAALHSEPIVSTPEPNSLVLLTVGLAGFLVFPARRVFRI
jgi:hypothetical protein